MTQSSTNQSTCIALITGTVVLIANKTILWLYYLIPSIRFIILLPFPFPFTIWIRWIIEVPALVVVSVKRHYTGGEKKIFYYQLNKMITNSEQLWKENKKNMCQWTSLYTGKPNLWTRQLSNTTPFCICTRVARVSVSRRTWTKVGTNLHLWTPLTQEETPSPR